MSKQTSSDNVATRVARLERIICLLVVLLGALLVPERSAFLSSLKETIFLAPIIKANSSDLSQKHESSSTSSSSRMSHQRKLQITKYRGEGHEVTALYRPEERRLFSDNYNIYKGDKQGTRGVHVGATWVSRSLEGGEETSFYNSKSIDPNDDCGYYVDLCGIEVHCSSLAYKRWSHLRDTMEIQDLYDTSSVQYEAACHILINNDSLWSYEPDLNIDSGRLVQTYAMTVLSWGNNRYLNRNEICEHRRIDDEWCEFAISVEGNMGPLRAGVKRCRCVEENGSACSPHGDYDIHQNYICDKNDRVVYLQLDPDFLVGSSEYARLNVQVGRLPSELWLLKDLQSLSVDRLELPKDDYNNFPTEIGKLTSLQYLDMQNIQLSGYIATEIGHLKQLRFLNLAQNHLIGGIPSTLGNLRNMTVLDLRSNKLYNTIPEQLSQLTKIEKLFLQENFFTSSIPSGLSKLKNLKVLRLEGQNYMTGTAPALTNAHTYVTDCAVECSTCTACCYDDDVEGERRCYGSGDRANHQKSNDRNVAITLVAAVVIVPSIFILILAAVARCVRHCCWKKLSTRIDPSVFCELGSVYWFALPGASWRGISLFLLVVISQIAIFSFFLYYIIRDKSESQNRVLCNVDSERCENIWVNDNDYSSSVNEWNYLPAALVLFVYLLKDITIGVRMVIRGGATRAFRLILTGTAMILITTLAVMTTLWYFINFSPSRTESLTNAVSVIFVNDIDEKVYETLLFIFPKWVSSQREKYLIQVEIDKGIEDARMAQDETGSKEKDSLIEDVVLNTEQLHDVDTQSDNDDDFNPDGSQNKKKEYRRSDDVVVKGVTNCTDIVSPNDEVSLHSEQSAIEMFVQQAKSSFQKVLEG